MKTASALIILRFMFGFCFPRNYITPRHVPPVRCCLLRLYLINDSKLFIVSHDQAADKFRTTHNSIIWHFLKQHLDINRNCIEGFDQRVARQQLCKHSPLLGYAKIEEAVLSVSAVTSTQWIVITWHAFTVGRCPFLGSIGEQNS
jgi:hypothetical protein